LSCDIIHDLITTVLQLSAITKTFRLAKRRKTTAGAIDPRERGRTFYALDGIDLEIPSGGVLGLLGQNGAGKTTLLRILSTSLKPSSGVVLCDGEDLTKNPLEIRRRIGFVSGNTGLYGRLTAREMLLYYGRLQGMQAAALRERIDELSATLDMQAFLDRRNETFSSGMRQKVSIARALIHDPDILLFDELTTGLDVAAAESVLAVVEMCRERNKTVLFSTHHMDEVDQLCDRVAILHAGRLCFEGNAAGMRQQTGESFLDKAFLKIIKAEPGEVAA